jgi:hypothetical protein
MRTAIIFILMTATLMGFLVAEGKAKDNVQHIENNVVCKENSSRCWSMTQSGNRCKRRAASGRRYCKQHSADRVPKRKISQCRSMTTNDVQCLNAPISDKSYCEEHMK